MPDRLIDAYKVLLISYNRFDQACSDLPHKHIYGGNNLNATLDHFSERFGVSICRIECLLIDPDKAFTPIPNDLLTSFMDGNLTILDVPCGTGAAGISFLTTIASLRHEGVLPQLPLNITILGADYSVFAIDIYEEILNNMMSFYESAGITVVFNKTIWDASQPCETSALVDRWFDLTKDAEEYLLIIANFSGEASNNFNKYQRSFQHVFERLHNKVSSILWVEPGMKSAKPYLNKIHDIVIKYASWFIMNRHEPINHQYNWHHPFKHVIHPCNILVNKYERK